MGVGFGEPEEGQVQQKALAGPQDGQEASWCHLDRELDIEAGSGKIT